MGIIKKTTIWFLMLMFVSSIAFINTSCDKDEADKDAPDIPPLSTFLMDFSDFDNPDDTLNGTKTHKTYQNWGHSFFNVAVWNAIITIGMAVPVATFVESFNHTPIYYSNDKEWRWTYTVYPGNVAHTCRLTASISGNFVHWKMFVSKQGGFQNFMWYEGKSHLDGTNGYWILYESPHINQRLVQIDWNKESSGISDIKYTNVKPGGPENGGYIHHGIQDDEVYDAFYDIYNKGQDNLTQILYHRTTKIGRVKDPNKFGDNEWHCWGPDLADKECED